MIPAKFKENSCINTISVQVSLSYDIISHLDSDIPNCQKQDCLSHISKYSVHQNS